MNRRIFGQDMCCALVASLVGFPALSKANSKPEPLPDARPQSRPPLRSLPTRVAGVRIPDSAVARAAIELAYDASPSSLFNHTARTYLFGQLMGRSMHLPVDDELLFLACILHDLGLTERFMGPAPFQVQGADAAQQFLQEHAVPSSRTEVVWDGIALHPYGAIASRKRPEIALVSSGAGTDVTGYALGKFTPDDVKAILAAFPRMGFKSAFVRTCAGVVRRYPDAAHRSFMEDIGRRHVPGFNPPNICDAIAAAPFEE